VFFGVFGLEFGYAEEVFEGCGLAVDANGKRLLATGDAGEGETASDDLANEVGEFLPR
jgi:hypothetical protein